MKTGFADTNPQSDESTGDKTLVLGLGNILRGDDGLGVRVAEMLKSKKLPANVSVEDAGTPGLGLVARIQGWERVIIVDAAYTGQKPGAWRCFGVDDIDINTGAEPLSLHESDVVSALTLAKAVKMLPPEVLIYGVEPLQIDWGTELSPAVEKALPNLVDDIMADLWKREG